MATGDSFFYAYGRPKEDCQQKLTDARRVSRGEKLPYSIAKKHAVLCAFVAGKAGIYGENKCIGSELLL